MRDLLDVGPDLRCRRIFARPVVVGLERKLVLPRQHIDKEAGKGVVAPGAADLGGLLVNGEIDAGAFQRLGHEQPRYAGAGDDDAKFSISHHTSQIATRRHLRQSKFKPPAALSTTDAGNPCRTLAEPPSLPPSGARCRITGHRGGRSDGHQRQDKPNLLSVPRPGRRNRARPGGALRAFPAGRRQQRMGGAGARPARDAGGPRPGGAPAEARDHLCRHAIRALSQRRPRRALGEGRAARPRPAGVVDPVPPARPRRDPRSAARIARSTAATMPASAGPACRSACASPRSPPRPAPTRQSAC